MSDVPLWDFILKFLIDLFWLTNLLFEGDFVYFVDFQWLLDASTTITLFAWQNSSFQYFAFSIKYMKNIHSLLTYFIGLQLERIAGFYKQKNSKWYNICSLHNLFTLWYLLNVSSK